MIHNRYCRVLIALLFLSPSVHATETAGSDVRKLYITDARPLTRAANAIAEDFGVAVTYEESPYVEHHPMSSIFPGGVVLPEPVTLVVEYSHSGGLDAALDRLLAAAAEVLPEPYTVKPLPDGGRAIVPQPTEASDVPLDAQITLPRGPLSVRPIEAIDILRTQIGESFHDVEIHLAFAPPATAQRVALPPGLPTKSARELLTEIASLLTENAFGDKIFSWQLRYGPESSKAGHKDFVLVFYGLRPADQNLQNVLYVESERPMIDAARLFEREFGIPITVEEPPALCDGDLFGYRGTPNITVRGGSIDMRWSNDDSLRDALERLVLPDKLRDSSSIELYELDWNETHPILKPTRMRNEQAEVVDHEPLLDTDLTDQLKAAPESLSLADIAALVSAKTGQRVVAGSESVTAADVTSSIEISKKASVEINLKKLLSEGAGPAAADVSFHLIYDPALQGYRLIAHRLQDK